MTRRSIPFAFLLILFASISGEATTVKGLSDSQLTRSASRVFRGKVVETRSELAVDGRIVTRVRFEVNESLKGTAAPVVELLQPGGTFAGRTLVVAGAASFSSGEEVVVFVGKVCPRTGCAFTVGLAQGKYRVVRDSGPARVQRRLGGLTFVGPRPASQRRLLSDLLGSVRTAVESNK